MSSVPAGGDGGLPSQAGLGAPTKQARARQGNSTVREDWGSLSCMRPASPLYLILLDPLLPEVECHGSPDLEAAALNEDTVVLHASHSL